MKSYLSLISISAKVRRRQNRMTLLCIIFAVFLVTAVFSMVEAVLKMETRNLIAEHGYWHMALENVSEDVAEQIGARSDVDCAAWYSQINGEAQENYSIGERKAVLYGVDEAWITNIWDCLEEGTFPKNAQEVMLSPNVKELLDVGIGESITLNTPFGSQDYIISGFGEHDVEFNKLYDSVMVYMDRTAFSKLPKLDGEEETAVCYIRFKTNRGAGRRITQIKDEYDLADENIDENTALLGITGYSSNEYAKQLYPIAAVLFVVILAAGVLMISSSMNSNVSKRTQFFGMMRCIGMSKKQVICFVRLEALSWCKTAIPIGIVLGIAVTWGLSAWLRYGIGGELSELPIFMFSAAGILFGAAVGILSVFIAASAPAKQAAKVSPVAAVSQNEKGKRKVRRTMHTNTFRIETALGVNHAVSARKNLLLMMGSFALSIVLFFGFSAGIDFVEALMPSIRSWQPDLAITSYDGSCSVDKGLAEKIGKVPGVSQVYGIMAALDIPVTSAKEVKEVTLASYEEYLFSCAEDSKVSGDFSKISGDSNYVLTIYDATNPLDVGDKIQMNGIELEVAGIVSEGVFEDDITLICTEETFERLMGESDYALLSMQFSRDVETEDISQIRSLIDRDYHLVDYRESNAETRAEYWAFRLIVYAFLVIIVLIAILNIINSTSMSVSARTKQYGVMRAVGMSGRQLTKMIVAEVFTYAFTGCAIGCALGLMLNKLIFESFITAYFGEAWHVPVGILFIILLVMCMAAAAAVYAPAKRMKNMVITDTINEL